MKPLYFKLYASNIPVRGKDRSALYDLDGEQIHIIPQVVYDLLQWMKQCPLIHIQQSFTPAVQKLLREMIRKAEQNGWGFYTDEPERFPPLSLQWHCPGRIQTAVIEYAFRHYALEPVIRQLDELLCQHIALQLRVKKGNTPCIPQLLELFEQKTFRSVTLLTPHHSMPLTTVFNLFKHCRKLYRCILYGAPVNKKYALQKNEQVFLVRRTLTTPSPPAPQYIVNRPFFCESLRYNPYYNRKVCIARSGNIKNCLEQHKSFGRVPWQTLEQVISQPGFRKLWDASPDKIPSAKHSELRYAKVHKLNPYI